MTKVSELGQKILKEKYFAEGETTPEHLFRRVAKVCSIPDAVDALLASFKEDIDVEGRDLWDDKVLSSLFGKYADLAERVILRRARKRSDFRRVPTSSINRAALAWKEYEDKYFEAMENLDFMPATPTLMNAGLGGMLSSCFAIRVPDSMEGIFDVVKDVALISKAGGGVGLEVSELRPEGSKVGGSGKSSGPISFLKVFNETGNQVVQGGKRRSALLAGMSISHPDIFKFISCKEHEGTLSNFNLSIFIPDAFMIALENGGDVALNHPKSGTTEVVPAKKIWDALVKRAHANGEPGIIFQDHLDKDDITKGKFGKFISNPCNELNLHDFSSCNLASINLSNCYKAGQLDKEKLENLVCLVTRFLDNVVDLNNYPLEKIADMTLKLRPIGIGSMGLHDLMLKFGIRYGSKESLDLIADVYGLMKTVSEKQSTALASIRGIPEELKLLGIERRNGFLRNVAPTGTISIFCGCSSGLEPVFQWEYTRKDSYGTHKVRHWMLDKYGSVDNLPEYAKTALETPAEEHVRVQAQVQKYLDEAISKTCNCPYEATVEDVSNIYKLAYELGCKSITVYRSGSRKEEVLNVEREKVKEEVKEPVITTKEHTIRARPRILWGCTVKVNTPQGKCYITINEDPCGIRELLVSVAKAGSAIVAHCEAEGRLISSLLKHSVPVTDIIRQLEDQKSGSIVWDCGKSIKSIPDAIAQTLREYKNNYEGFSQYIEDPVLTSAEESDREEETGEFSGELCPECGENMVMREGGCVVCKSCGNSRC